MNEPQMSGPGSDAPAPQGLPSGVKKLLGWSLAITLAVVGLTVVLFRFSGVLAEREKEQKELATAERGVIEQGERDRRELGGFAQVDAKKGVYRIPIERALALVEANPRLLDPVAQQPPPAPPGPPVQKPGAPAKGEGAEKGSAPR